jgi:N-formylglutamate deformylase
VIDPFRIHRPVGPPVLLYDSPHSGRHYPSDFVTKATGADLRRGEDAYVDDLLGHAPAYGVCVLEAVYPRCYIDVNREETDIDAALLAEPWPEPLTPTDKSARGLGLIRRYVVPGVEVHAHLLSVPEVRARIAHVYRPYHAALGALVEEIRGARGTVWHIDWHSMKSVGNAMTPDGAGAARPDFVVSDLEGRSASPTLTTLVVDQLRGFGYGVSVNTPYKGGTIVQLVGAPDRGVHSIQIEINRALYLDEQRVEKTAGFEGLARKLEELTRSLASAAPKSAR